MSLKTAVNFQVIKPTIFHSHLLQMLSMEELPGLTSEYPQSIRLSLKESFPGLETNTRSFLCFVYYCPSNF
jgi:hypothetical protein